MGNNIQPGFTVISLSRIFFNIASAPEHIVSHRLLNLLTLKKLVNDIYSSYSECENVRHCLLSDDNLKLF